MMHPRRMREEFIRRTLFPLSQRHFYPGAAAHLRRWRELEQSPPALQQAWSVAARLRLLRHATHSVPYYRDLERSCAWSGALADLGSESGWRELPILTKRILRERHADLISETHTSDRLLPNASGGSTGTPVRVMQDTAYWDQARASQWWMESWWGLRPGEPCAALWGADRDLHELGWKDRLYEAICQTQTCNVFKTNAVEMEQFARRLCHTQPPYIFGYASALELFARFLLQHPHLPVRPRVVKSSAETLTPEARGLIESALQAPVYDFYGSREVNNLAAQCAERRGLHVNAFGRYLEIVDENGAPAPAGVPGRILVTDLTNFAMPMIRYENEDIGVWSAAPCPCGRSLPTLERVLGRRSDFIHTPAGKLIHGEYFTHWFYELPQVRTFQLLQSTLDRIRLDVVLAEPAPPPSGSDALLASLRSRLQETMGAGVVVEVRRVPSIERSASGKHRFTISHVTADSAAPREAAHAGS